MTKDLAKLRVTRLRLLVQEFIKKSPSFDEAMELAGNIGVAMADVEDVIRDWRD